MDSSEIKFTFGQYNGNSIKKVYDVDKGYLYWCIKTPGVIRRHPRLTLAIRAYMEDCKRRNFHRINNNNVLKLKVIA